ncbi:TetR/AcrR family transcriptional regulator [Nocardioides sp. CPCC 206347]|uniref:TetR/AcrR family transcriptional regulator n=2 Tax=Nocardioides TaxID=1839 RepID=UPI003B430F5D
MSSATSANASARRSGTKGVARADREQQILDVAGRVFAEHGFTATSVADIADQAGISKPLIYNYFGSKDGLFERCLQVASELLVAEIERTAQLDVVGIDRALATLDGVFKVLAGRPWMWRIANDPTAPEIGLALLGSYRRRLEDIAIVGVGQLLTLAGDHDPLDLEALTAVWSSVFSALVTWWIEHPDVTPEEMTSRCGRLFGVVFGVVPESPGA